MPEVCPVCGETLTLINANNEHFICGLCDYESYIDGESKVVEIFVTD